MDLRKNRNVHMLFQVDVVFNRLSHIHQEIEGPKANSFVFTDTHFTPNGRQIYTSSPKTHHSVNRVSRHSHIGSRRLLSESSIEKINYLLMFSEGTNLRINHLIQQVHLARSKISNEVVKMEKDLRGQASALSNLALLKLFLRQALAQSTMTGSSKGKKIADTEVY
jgi:hypothetical protein